MNRPNEVSEFKQAVIGAVKLELEKARNDCFSGCGEIKQGYLSGLQASIRIINTTYNIRG